MEIPKQELWESRLADWETSGMDIRSWCRKENLDEKQFHYWKRQLRTALTVSETVFAEYTGGGECISGCTDQKPAGTLYTGNEALCSGQL